MKLSTYSISRSDLYIIYLVYNILSDSSQIIATQLTTFSLLNILILYYICKNFEKIWPLSYI